MEPYLEAPRLVDTSFELKRDSTHSLSTTLYVCDELQNDVRLACLFDKWYHSVLASKSFII